jgi:hypothetical protein
LFEDPGAPAELVCFFKAAVEAARRGEFVDGWE